MPGSGHGFIPGRLGEKSAALEVTGCIHCLISAIIGSELPLVRFARFTSKWLVGHNSGLARLWIELGTESESLFQVLDKDAHFG
jgi:hypothetical protein